MNDNNDKLLEIPYAKLSPEALDSIIEEYCTRGGHDSTMPVSQRKQVVYQQLKKKEATIVFNPVEESVNIVSGPEYRQYLRNTEN